MGCCVYCKQYDNHKLLSAIPTHTAMPVPAVMPCGSTHRALPVATSHPPATQITKTGTLGVQPIPASQPHCLWSLGYLHCMPAQKQNKNMTAPHTQPADRGAHTHRPLPAYTSPDKVCLHVPAPWPANLSKLLPPISINCFLAQRPTPFSARPAAMLNFQSSGGCRCCCPLRPHAP